ncbi:hypothetical protein GCM10029978_022040 [Actinoallomurus acanthiterrae]
MDHSSTRRMVGKATALAFAVGVFTAAGAVSVGVASATTPAPTTPASADFAAQAKSAGLSNAQAKTLQTRVDRYVADYHGTQIAANKVSAKGMYITVALPGEKYARTLPAAPGVHANDVWQDKCLADNPIYSGWFCLYKGEVFQGDVLSMYTCGDHNIYGWYNNGSWVNNQTKGTVALLRSASGGYKFYTGGAYDSSQSFNWTPVDVVHPC